jgi:hypothetical protein
MDLPPIFEAKVDVLLDPLFECCHIVFARSACPASTAKYKGETPSLFATKDKLCSEPQQQRDGLHLLQHGEQLPPWNLTS